MMEGDRIRVEMKTLIEVREVERRLSSWTGETRR